MRLSVYRIVLAVIGFALWWQLLSTADQALMFYNIVSVDKESFAICTHRTPPIGKRYSRLQLVDQNFQPLTDSIELELAPQRPIDGLPRTREIPIMTSDRTGGSLRLYDLRTMAYRTVPDRHLACSFAPGGDWLICVNDKDIDAYWLRLYSVHDLQLVDELKIARVSENSYWRHELGSEFCCIENKVLVYFENGRFRQEPFQINGHKGLWCQQIHGDAMVVRCLEYVNADGNVIDATEHEAIEEAEIAYELETDQERKDEETNPADIDPGSSDSQWRRQEGNFIYWPKSQRIESIPTSLLTEFDSFDGRLIEHGEWLLSFNRTDKSQGFTTIPTVTTLDGRSIFTLPQLPRQWGRKYNAMLQQLQPSNWQMIVGDLTIWDAASGEKVATFNAITLYGPKLGFYGLACLTWIFAWVYNSPIRFASFASLLGAVPMVTAIISALAVSKMGPIDLEVANWLDRLAVYITIPVATAWLAYSQERIIVRYAQVIIILGLAWQPVTQMYGNAEGTSLSLYLLPISLTSIVLRVFRRFDRRTASLDSSASDRAVRRFSILDLVTLTMSVAIGMHILGLTDEMGGKTLLAILQLSDWDSCLNVGNMTLITFGPNLAILLFCFGSKMQRFIACGMLLAGIMFAVLSPIEPLSFWSILDVYTGLLVGTLLLIMIVRPFGPMIQWCKLHSIGRTQRPDIQLSQR